MINTQRCVVQGFRKAKGQVEGSAPYDYTELYISQSIDPESGSGSATVPFKFGKSDNAVLFSNQQFPQELEIDFLTTTNGRGVYKQVITAVRKPK